MRLRSWQRACIRQAKRHFASGMRHFLCLATPGAGKTHMASTLAADLLKAGQIDLVICFAPSVIVANDFRDALEALCAERFDGQLGARGTALTYQAMLTQPESFWALLRNNRVLVIFDEIHHCAGQHPSDANAWGERIITHVQNQAAYTLALTGTPWRSDQRPIALASYGNDTVECDYRYGLDRAIADAVCRIPVLTLIDNEYVTLHTNDSAHAFSGLKSLLSARVCRYEDVLRSDDMIRYCLKKATGKLDQVRKKHSDAGGLIVAASVDHAHQISNLLYSAFGESAYIATYQEPDAQGIIRRYKHGIDKWIISVGMISEGTNIPRLRVCCHLTRIKTELYFRQVLGRILRANGTHGDQAYFYMPAEPTLVEYANRLIEDVPDGPPVIRDSGPSIPTDDDPYTQPGNTTIRVPAGITNVIELGGTAFLDQDYRSNDASTELRPPSIVSTNYENQLAWSEHFHGDVLSVLGIPSH